MKKLLGLILALALCAISVSALADDNTVTAIGTGTVTLVPDMATFSVGINTQDALVSTAQAANTAAMQAVLDRADEPWREQGRSANQQLFRVPRVRLYRQHPRCDRL